MDRLQKKAWIELGLVAVILLVGAVGLAVLVATNARGVHHVIIFLVVGCIVGLPTAYYSYKDECKYDERERAIRQRAFQWASGAMIMFFAASSFIPFFLIGGKGNIAVYYMPMMFFGCLMIAQTVQSAVIIFKCATDTL